MSVLKNKNLCLGLKVEDLYINTNLTSQYHKFHFTAIITLRLHLIRTAWELTSHFIVHKVNCIFTPCPRKSISSWRQILSLKYSPDSRGSHFYCSLQRASFCYLENLNLGPRDRIYTLFPFLKWNPTIWDGWLKYIWRSFTQSSVESKNEHIVQSNGNEHLKNC